MRKINVYEVSFFAVMAFLIAITFIGAWDAYRTAASKAYFEQCLISGVFSYSECDRMADEY
jgi:uncharacterized membrane protein YiaA